MDSSDDESKHYLLAINALNKSVSDTEKFGALCVVCHVLKDKQKDLNCHQLKQLFKSIESNFLCRLLLSDGQSSEIPDGCPQYIYQTIGVSIITSFMTRIADYIDFKTSTQLLSSMALVLKQLKDKDIDLDESERQMAFDIVLSFECFFSSDHMKQLELESINHLFDTKFSQILCEIYSNHKFNEMKTQINELLSKIAITIEWSELDSKSFEHFMSSIVDDFGSIRDKHKFELCHTLNAILTKNHNYFVNETNNRLIGSISDTIFEILRNKLSRDLRDPVLKLVATLTEILNGFRWINWKNEWNDKNSKHFVLLLRLSCIEIAVNYESENVDISCVANCFVILEHSVITIANDSERMDLLKHFTAEDMYNMLTAIRDTMSVIIRYLKRFSDENTEIDSNSDLFVSILASIRVLSVWVTEETEALREDIADILPFIVKVFRNSYESSVSINKSIISALIAFAENDNLKNILLNENLNQFLDIVSAKEPTNDLLIKNLKKLLNE